MTTDKVFLDPTVGWILLALFSVLWVGLGIYWGRRNKSFEDHALAGRNIGLALGTATAAATWITSNTTMLAPQFALQLGVWGMLAYSTAAFGLILFAPMAKRIRELMPHGYTSGDFFRLRYGKLAWGIFLIFTLFYSLTWLVSMAMAGGILLEALAGIDYAWGMSVILGVCVIYTMRGGLAAVIGTDFIQSLIIIVGIVVVGFSVLQNVSVEQIHANLSATKPALLDVLFPAAIMAIFNNLLFGLGEVFHNNVWWSRAFAFRKGVAGKAFLIGGLVWLPIPVAAGFIALASGALGVAVPSADMVGPLVVAQVLGSVGAIGVFIIVFCSLASSIDSLLAATSDLVTEDIWRKLLKRGGDSPSLKRTAQMVTLGLGVLTWLVCLPRIGTLATVLFFAGPLVGAMIWPIVTGLYWRSANALSAVGAMVLGAGVGLICYFAIAWYVATLIATAVSMVWVLVVCALSSSRFDWTRLKETA
ncbi:sodium:solute symporter family transporter [Croceicoccus naphthovorans]|uniref:Urea transporter n=1 Tax=Croceicoccus naphthovorans TaxID=1348774 RepID=A0A0G3XGR3_9SPHN|nr:urea transporter [Croceicoccus naphthovorans]AKM10720.1 urea transporter [Croceicoccus naphthovorans]MBB3991818.1 Na+/proline symporter [Croceicoccus naphthovorans]